MNDETFRTGTRRMSGARKCVRGTVTDRKETVIQNQWQLQISGVLLMLALGSCGTGAARPLAPSHAETGDQRLAGSERPTASAPLRSDSEQGSPIASANTLSPSAGDPSSTLAVTESEDRMEKSDLLTVVEQCSVASDQALVLALALTFSAGDPVTVKDVRTTTGGGAAKEAPALRQEALTHLRSGSLHGGVVAGLLPAVPAWAATLGRPVDDLLEACSAVGIATAFLSEFEHECGPQASRDCVARKYLQAVDLQPLRARVLRAAKDPDLDARAKLVAVNVQVACGDAPDAPTVHCRDWGADRIVFPKTKSDM
jgi:hypothetical protein